MWIGRRALLGVVTLALLGIFSVPETAALAGGGRARVQGIDAPVRVYRLATATIDFRTDYVAVNPFDPVEVEYRAVAVGPDGATRNYLAFWYQPFERALVDGQERLVEHGEPHWRVRITPDVVGAWRWHLQGRDPTGAWSTRNRDLAVVPSSPRGLGHRGVMPRGSVPRGMVRRSPHDDRYLAYDDGTAYFAVGENLGWYDARGTYAYDVWLRDLRGAGANFARLWMSSWAFGIEWNDTPLGDYSNRLDRAWQLDLVFERARANGVQIELALLNHGAFSTQFNSEWASNPYNVANGGPLNRPQDFFTDPVAKALFRQRLRYVVARWGAAPNLLAWEFWNEVDLTDGFDPAAVAAWHREMAGFVRFIDPHHHLISSSTAIFPNETQLWADGGLDFAQVHLYARIGDTPLLPNFFNSVPELTALRRSQAAMPVLFAELGVDSRGPAETLAADPDGIGVHDGLWAGVVSGGFGTAMPWWWDNLTHLDWSRYGPMFARVRAFTRGIAFDRERFVVATLATGGNNDGGVVAARALVGVSTALVWVKDQAFQWTDPNLRSVSGATLTLELGAGRWCGRWLDTWSDVSLGWVSVAGGRVVLPVPDFTRDVALRLRRCT